MAKITSEMIGSGEVLKFDREGQDYKQFLAIKEQLSSELFNKGTFTPTKRALENARAIAFYSFIRDYLESISIDESKLIIEVPILAIDFLPEKIHMRFEQAEMNPLLGRYLPQIFLEIKDFQGQTILRSKGILERKDSDLKVLEEIVFPLITKRENPPTMMEQGRGCIGVSPIIYLTRVLGALKTAARVVGYDNFIALKDLAQGTRMGPTDISAQVLKAEYDRRLEIFRDSVRSKVDSLFSPEK